MLKDAYYAYACGWAWLTQYHTVGTNIYDHDWDVLLVLDSTRVDLLQEAAALPNTRRDRPPAELSIPGARVTFDTIWSVGSITTEWLARTFSPAYQALIGETAFLAATPHTATVWDDESVLTNELDRRLPYPSPDVVPRREFLAFDELWQYAHDDSLGVVPPDRVTDRAISYHRREQPPRMVVHYIQPHEPFIAPDTPKHVQGESVMADDIWTGLADGRLDPDEVWPAYRANLRLALDEVARLLENLSADRVVVTSDHGNLYGELAQWGHPFGMPHPAVRRVPWLETTAIDRETSTPDPPEPATENVDVDERLAALGYR